MKPHPFRYHDPRSLEEALDLLAERDDAKLLAGGQSLMPMLNMRFVLPEDVIDLNRIPELSYVREADGVIEIGAMARQHELESSDVIRRRCPLMSEALLQIGHRATRNRGTIGGSLCHLDPAAELPVVAMALDATVHAQSRRGARKVPMAEFPAFYMTPAIEPDEIVTALGFEPWPEGHGYAFMEFARRHGDFAVVAVAALLDLSGDGTIRRASVTLGGVGQKPLQCMAAEDMLTGSAGDASLFREAAETCRKIDAMEDVHTSVTYRRQLAVTLTERALGTAFARATGGATP